MVVHQASRDTLPRFLQWPQLRFQPGLESQVAEARLPARHEDKAVRGRGEVEPPYQVAKVAHGDRPSEAMAADNAALRLLGLELRQENVVNYLN